MSDPKEKEYYESLIQYYRMKCNQMEHDFVIHKIRTEQALKDLNFTINTMIAEKEKERLDLIYNKSKKDKLIKLKNKVVEEQKSKK
jgi:predicted ester cyclase